MLKNFETMKMGGLVFGLAMLVSLVAALPAKAGIIRATEDESRNLETIFYVDFTKDQVTGNWTGAQYFAGSSEVGSGFNVQTFPNGLSLSAVSASQTSGSLPYRTIDYAASVTATGTDSAGLDLFLDGVIFRYGTQSVDGFGIPTTTWVESSYTGGIGNFFYDLWENYLKDGYTIEFDFLNTGDIGDAYTFTFYRETSDVPEPATLAILGLGLAGLGMARRRKK